MRPKQLRLILTVPTTMAAMAMEQICLARGIPGRLIPVPTSITAGCGMAWSAPPDARAQVLDAAQEGGVCVDGLYELVI